MPTRIFLTTTSFQDTPGAHHDVLSKSGFEVVTARGPLKENEMLDLVKKDGGFDGFLNGDDHITAKVIDAALPRLKVIAKYGIGLDSIDVKYATAKNLPVLFTPGVNHTTVAEHTFGLMICLVKNFWVSIKSVKDGQWKRPTGHELFGKTHRRHGRRSHRQGSHQTRQRVRHEEHGVRQALGRRLRPGVRSHAAPTRWMTPSAPPTSSPFIWISPPKPRAWSTSSASRMMKKGAILINTARGGLVVEKDIADACRSGQLGGYGADVLNVEPMVAPHPFQEIDNIIITTHIGSRTYESVQRQGLRAAHNIVNYLNGDSDFIQANKF